MIIKFIKKKFDLIKICAVFTTICFVVSTLGANLYAIPLAENANQKYEDVFNKASSISAEYGKITSSRDGNSDITIINIQDLHCHPQTQRNISKIIAQIAEKYNLKEIYVEGGYGNIDLNWLTSIKDENIRKQVAEKLLEEGLLTGSEYYKLTSGNKDVELKGIDEEDLHRENVKRLAWIIENQGKYKDVIKKVENEINILEKIYVNSRNERFNRDIEKYLTSEIDTRRFYRQLIKYVKDINANPDKYNNITAIRLEDYPNIVKFITLRKISKDIDVRKVTQQLQAVINELKNRLPYNIYTQLLKETENLSDSQKVVELVTSLCKKEGIDLEYKYKALNDFLQSNEINRELNTVELVYEERQLITEIRKALSYNNEEYEITFVSDFSRFFKDYLEYKLTDADWKYFESGYEQFRQLYAKYATIDRIREIEKEFTELNKYYEINDIRNEVFVNNLLQDKHPDVTEQSKFREDEEILKGSKEVIIAVTGGFHSNALEDILQAKEVNTIVITPSIFEGIEKATKQYKGIIKEQSKEFQHQALAYRILSSLNGQEQKIYLYGALKSLLGDNINKLKEVLGEDVDLDSLEKELQNLQLSSDEQSQLKVSRTTQFLESVVDAIINEPLFPKEGGKAVFVPNVNKIILKVSETLVDAGIFLSNGPIFAAEQQGLPYLKEIAPEIYSRMPAFIQEALFATEVFAIEESAVEEDIDEEVPEKSETVIEDEEVYSSYFYEEEKAELLERVRDKNKPFPVDQDLVFSVFEKMIVPFIEDNNVDNLDEHYEDFLRKLFSLQSENLNFLNDKMDAQSIKDLLVYYDAEVIDKNLTDLLARYSKKLSSLKDFSRIVFLFENIEKLNSLSEQDFDYFMDLPRQIFVYVWGKSEDSSQLKTKITAGKIFYPKKRFKTFDRDLAKAYFANAEKLESLDESYYERFIGLNKEAQIFILDNVKSSFDIERIFEFSDELFSDKNKISSNFDEKVKDFTDVRFKALVKYISSVDDMSFYDKLFSVDYYGQKDIFGDYDKRSQKVLKIIVDSIDDANFIKEYLLNPEYKKKYSSLFRRLVELKIENVAVENDYLALKLLTDENFNKALDDSKIHVGVPTSAILVARYHAAIAVSRFIYDGAEGEIKDYDISEHKELIKEITDLYILLLRAADGNVVMDSKTKIYVLCNDEKNKDRLTDRFNTASIERMAKLAGVETPIITYLRKDNLYAKDAWLDQIEELVLASDAKAYFLFNGHGEKNRLCVKNGEEYISAEELADRLFNLATRPGNPVDLRRVTIDLSCCHSYFFARDVYKLLEEKFKDNPDKESYPTIITAAGLETEVGYTRIGAGAVTLSNLHDGILTVLNKRTEPAPITLGMLALSEYQFSLSNITMFTSFSDETLLERIAETKKHISAAFKDSKGKAIEVESKTSDPRVKLKTKVPNLPIFGFEASIFKEDNYAPIWEEVVYRFAPALMLTILISVTMMFAPAGFVLFTKIGFAVILTLFQTIFVKAHIVTDWLRAKDSGGEKSSEEVPETSISDKQSKTVDLGKVFEKDLTFEDKINKIFKTVKERLFAVFSDSKDAESFKIFYKTNKIAAEHKDGLIIPTIAFTIPYVVVMCFFPSIQAVMIATIVSMALHAINNIVAKIIKEKGLLQKKKRDIDFQDIQRRIKHIKLLIENPNVERDLPELKEGSFVLKFGLARKAERRAESLLEYEKIRIFFINRLKDEMAKREEIKAELETIKKARKTKKNKAKIQELEEQLEIMEKEYPRIYNELLFADTKEVEKTIDKIDALLSIFEEIDIILDNIENFKRENADDEDAYKEIKALEEDFLDFAENTFMNSLMSLYNNQKTTGIHVRRVVGDSNLIGTKMLSSNNVRMMYKLMLSSILHDIGKNLVPLQILDKQGSFDRLERNIMEFHVVFGGIILRSSILRRLSYTAENHHRYTLKTKMDDLGKETEVGDLHIPTISSLDEEKEEQIERIVKFLEEINPDLSFDSASQYPKSLEDIKSILEDNDMDLTESQQEKLDDLLREVEQIEEEVLIAKIVSLADVFEAVSPKLSFDSERTYQFPQKIRDISSMLENIDIDLTESQKREVIVLLAEIAQIDSEEDVTKKKEMEQAFIKKVLYNRSRSFVINYIREKNYDSVRANAFKIVFTKSPQEVFKELGKTEEEFMADFENDPKGTIDECMSLVDADKFEFDSDVIRAFLEFYFSSEDIRVNNAILESLNKGEENRFIVYIKDALYSLYKLQRSVNRMLVRFTPVIASVFRGLGEQKEGVSIKEKFNIDTVINYTVTIKRRNGDTHFLYFDEKGFQQMGRDSGITMSMGSYGIQEIKYDEDGKIVDIILEPGATIDTDASGGEILVGSEAENLSFEDIEEQIKENYERKHHQKLEQEGFLLKPIMEDTGTTEKVDVYLDDDVKTILATIEDAINNNKLMVIHVFKEGFKTQNLSLWQRYQKYKVVYGLLDSRSKFESTFSKTSEIEEQFLKQIEDGLSEEERDMEWIKRNAAKTFFALREILKNNFDHGNLGLFEYPIALHISKDDNGRVTEFSTYNLSTKPIALDRAEEKSLSDLMYEAYISGSHKGTEYMTDSFFTNLEYGDDIKISVGEENYRIYRTKVTLKTEWEQEQALEKYNQYRQEKAEERRKYEEASEAEKKAIDKKQMQAAWDDFWGLQTRDTVSRLYNRGLKKYLRQYLKRTGKTVENLTTAETYSIRQKAEKYRYTIPGLVYGVFLETFALWKSDFIDKHGFNSSIRGGMIAVVWTIRALSIGIGITTAILSFSALSLPAFLMPIVFTAILGTTTISSSFIIHLLWNIGVVLTNNKSLFSQPQGELIAAITPYLSIPKINGIFNTVGNHFSIKEKDAATGVERVDVYSKQILEDLKKGIINLPTDVQVSLIRLFNGEFNEKDNKVIHDYVFVGVRDSTTQEEREKYIKMFSVIYAYKTWEDLKRTNPGKIKTSSDGTEYIEAANNIILTFDNWVHICDAHCILTSGNEEVPNRYSSTRVAFESAITLDMLIGANSLIDNIINNWDISQKRNRQDTLYIKRVDDTVYSLVVKYDSNKGYYVETFYVIDTDKYENDFFDVVLPSFIKQPSKPYLDNTIKNNNMGIIRIKIDRTGNIIGRNRASVGLADSEVTTKCCSGFYYDGNPLNTTFLYSDGMELADGGIAVIDNRNKKIKVFFGQDNEVIEYDISRFTSVTILGNGKIEVVDSNGGRVEFNTKYLSSGIAYNDDGRILLADNYTRKRTPILTAIGGILSDCMKDPNDNRVRNQNDVNKILDLMEKFLQVTYWGKMDGSVQVFTAIQNFFMDMINIFNIEDLEKIKELLDKNDSNSLQVLLRSYQGVQDAIGTNLIRMQDIGMVKEFSSKLATNSDRTETKITEIANEVIGAHSAILPENMGLVNKIMQSKFGNAFVAATVIAFREFFASFNPNFVNLHQSAAGIVGAQELVDFINGYKVTNSDGVTARILKTVFRPILKVLFAGASIVKHIAIDYRYIKASGIQDAIRMFGKDAKLTEDGQIEVAIVEDIELLQDSFTLVNTGLKVDGASIYRIKDTNLLIYGARGQESIKVVKTLNGSDLLNRDIIEMLKANGENVDEIQAQAMVTKSGEGISITDDIIEIGEMEIAGKTPSQMKQFIASALEIKRVMGIMYGQKTIIDLKSVTDMEKLRATVYNGRARKVISKEQFNNLNLTEADIESLRQNGIEIYIDNGEVQLTESEVKDFKNKKVAGQIIRDNKGIRIKDYSTEEETKIEEILEDQNIESKILTAETPIMIGIDILTKHFKQGSVTAVQREFGALLGKIKMSLNLGELNLNDIEYMGYNINFNRIPTLTQEQIDTLFEKVGEDFQIVNKDKLIEIIGPETEFAMILKTIKNKDAEKRFKEIAVERILAKTALTESNKEFGLKDKNLEILLGRMLLAQVNNTDKQKTNISDDFRGSMDEVMEKIKEETEKAMQKDEVAINTIIELILVYGDNYKEKQLAREIDKNDIRNYRAMMSAA